MHQRDPRPAHPTPYTSKSQRCTAAYTSMLCACGARTERRVRGHTPSRPARPHRRRSARPRRPPPVAPRASRPRASRRRRSRGWALRGWALRGWAGRARRVGPAPRRRCALASRCARASLRRRHRRRRAPRSDCRPTFSPRRLSAARRARLSSRLRAARARPRRAAYPPPLPCPLEPGQDELPIPCKAAAPSLAPCPLPFLCHFPARPSLPRIPPPSLPTPPHPKHLPLRTTGERRDGSDADGQVAAPQRRAAASHRVDVERAGAAATCCRVATLDHASRHRLAAPAAGRQWRQ